MTQTFGVYEQIELIGKGSYGKVFKVRSSTETDEVYVLKKVAFDGTSQTEAEAALREAKVLSLLRHPHIVPYKEFFKHSDGDLCLVMAHCEGGDLFKHIKALRKSGKQLEEEQVWKWLVQLLLAVSYCHSKKILHRDIKTQNIFMSEKKLLLGDFGLAKQLQRTLEMARTPIGTPYYMAPEIYEEQPYSFKSDVWALGCVMYEMLTGRPAFAADNLSKVVIRVIRGNYDPLPDTYSPELREIISAMLSKSVKKRPEVNELLQHPLVVTHVQSYLDELSAAGPAGWSTWRMKLPPTVLAQMANVIAQARQSRPSSAVPAAAAAALLPQGAAAADSAAHGQQQGRGAAAPEHLGAGRHLPRQLEDMMTSAELIDGFSLQSLLQDPAQRDPNNVNGVANGEDLLVASLHPQDVKNLRAARANGVPGEAGLGFGGFDAAAAAAAPGRYADVGISNSFGTAPVAPDTPARPAVAAAAAGGGEASACSSRDAKAAADMGRCSISGLPPRLTGHLPPLPMADKYLNEHRAASSQMAKHASRKGSFAFDDLLTTAPRTPKTPTIGGDADAASNGAMFAAESKYEVDDNYASLGQISLHETLINRGVRLRWELTKQLGPQGLEDATRVVANFTGGKFSLAPRAEVEQQQIVAALRTLLTAQQMKDPLLPSLLDELLFLESRKQQAEA